MGGAAPAAELRARIAALEAELEGLRESERMYRFSAELGGRLVWSTDPDGNVVALSRLFESLAGIGAESSKRAWFDAIHAEDRGPVLERWADSLRTGEPFTAEFRALLADGSVRTARSKALPRRDAQGRILRWYGSTEDVHEERLAEQARRDVEERYKLAVQTTDEAVWDYDIVEGTVDWSANSALVFGADEPLARTSIEWWQERIHPDDRERVERSLAEAVDGDGTRWSASYRFRREDGSYAITVDRGFIIRDAAGGALRAVGAMADLTERHRAEAELRRMQAELIHVSRLSAMGTMASTLAHELNQPLTAVSNFVSGARRLAGKDGAPRPELDAALAAAAAAAERAGEIVRRLRELVARGAVAVQAEDLPRMIEEAGVLGFVDAAALGVTHRVELDPAARWVRADRIQIEQVLINLIRNAIEAMEGCPVREVAISTHALPGDLIEVCVADSGPGIAPEHADTLFSQFMTTKSGGIGIGLPICRTIVEAHGGTIQAENRSEGGALLRFTLPRARARERRAANGPGG